MLVKVTRAQAYKAIREGKNIIMAASNLRPEFGAEFPAALMPDKHHFETCCNAYRYYNCGPETGNKISFYVDEL